MLEILTYSGAFFAAVVGLALVAGALGALAKSKVVGSPLRWLWRRNISEPVGEWNRQIIRAVVDDRIEHLMHHRNSGSSLLDLSVTLERVEARTATVEGHVTTLLRHDAERDTAGHRYGPDTTDRDTTDPDPADPHPIQEEPS